MQNIKNFLFFSLAFTTGLAVYTLLVILIYRIFYKESSSENDLNQDSTATEDLSDLEKLDELEDFEEEEEKEEKEEKEENENNNV